MRLAVWIGLMAVFAFTAISCGRQEEGVQAARDAGSPEDPNTSATAIDDSSRQFLTTAAQINVAEVNLGRLAAEKSQNPQVREYAQMMITDHTNATDRMRSVAAGMSLPESLDAKHQALHDRLQNLSGPEFDRQYMEAMVTGHQEAIQLFQQQASAASGPAAQFASELLPTLQNHLQMAQQVQRNLAGSQ